MPLVASFGLVWAPPSRADSPSPSPDDRASWTLGKVLDAARQASPAIRAARARQRAGAATAAAAWGALSPRLSLRGGASRSNDPALLFSQRLWQGRFTSDDFALDALNQPPARNALEYGLVLEQPLWNGGAEVTTPAVAASARRESDAESRAAVADALLDVVRRYVDYVSARARSLADSTALAAAESAHRAAVERHRQGQVPDLDTLRTFARAAEGVERSLLAERDRDVSRRRLGDAIGASPSDDEIAAPDPTEPATFFALAAGGGRSAPSLEASRARARRLALEASRASLRLLPSLNGLASMTYYRDPELDGAERRWFAGLSLDWPIWDGARRWNERRAAAARAEGARADLEGATREWAAKEEAARRDLELAGPRRDAARAARRASEEALRLATSRYREGLLPLDAWLAVDADAASARERAIARDADLLLAGYAYLHAIGGLQ
ncbi:MAG TPA: TolC family protein [Candidatus Eisenbacteria bacterium]|nr:TolC family protein [Candidatus Eisenbacteria bacterium]